MLHRKRDDLPTQRLEHPVLFEVHDFRAATPVVIVVYRQERSHAPAEMLRDGMACKVRVRNACCPVSGRTDSTQDQTSAGGAPSSGTEPAGNDVHSRLM